jgi:DNA binding domain, excisionase family
MTKRTQPASPPRFYTPEAAAHELSISRAQIYKLMKSGEIDSVKIARSRRVPATALDDYEGKLRAQASEAA